MTGEHSLARQDKRLWNEVWALNTPLKVHNVGFVMYFFHFNILLSSSEKKKKDLKLGTQDIQIFILGRQNEKRNYKITSIEFSYFPNSGVIYEASTVVG